MALPRARVRSALFAVVVLACVAPHGSARADGVAITDAARARFAAGVNLLKDPEGPRYEEAYREFKAAYADSPSYKILGNLGLCAMKLERDDEAITAYEKYLKEGGKDLDPTEISQVKIDLQTLKSGVVYITLASDPPGAKIVDVRLPVRGERVTNLYGPVSAPMRIGVRQGSHQITAKLDGYPDVTWEVDAGGAEIAQHTFQFKKAVEAVVPIAPAPSSITPQTETVKTRPVPATVYVGAVATGVFTVGAVVTGLLALGKHSDYQTQNTGRDPATAQSTKDSGETLNLVNDICFGGAVVAAGVTAVLFFSRPTIEEQRPASVSGSPSGSAGSPFKPIDLRVAPTMSQTGGGLSFGGRF